MYQPVSWEPYGAVWKNEIDLENEEVRDEFQSTRHFGMLNSRYGILLPKLFWPSVRKNCSSDREKLLKFEPEGRESAKNLRLLAQFSHTVKGQDNFL